MPGLPPISACFLVEFDNRKGYSLKWHQAKYGLELEGIEYKCLPSGLHNVDSDLIYFTHDEFVGVAAFKQIEAAEAERNARFVSVGILAAQEDIWQHADTLHRFARGMLENPDNTDDLEQYWSTRSSEERQETSATQNDDLDPACSSMAMVNTLGPLMFPLYRATLLRKRILLISQPPLKPVCDYVYLLSQLSRPGSIEDNQAASQTIQPLFTVGVHDIAELSGTSAWNGDESAAGGWIACTSDELLATKYQLSEYRVRFPNTARVGSATSSWPTLTRTKDVKEEEVVRATRRDYEGWNSIRNDLRGRLRADIDRDEDDMSQHEASDGPATPASSDEDQILRNDFPSDIVEAPTWAASISQWSAQSTFDSEHEHECDELHLADAQRAGRQALDGSGGDARHYAAALLQSYLHKQTERMFSILSDRVAESEPDDTEYRDEPADEDERALLPQQNSGSNKVSITKSDMINMGLDVWSAGDANFVKEVVRLYFKREADVEVPGVDLCGVRIC